MLKQKYFLTGIFILSAERQPIKLAWRKIVWLQNSIYSIQKEEGVMPKDLQFFRFYNFERQHHCPDTVPSLHWKAKREKLIKEYTTTKNGSFIMNSDKTFSSPSSVADFCIGSSNNGWIVWKDKHGNTLDSVYRKQLE